MKNILSSFKAEYFSLFSFSAVINILMLAPAWYMLQVYDRVLTSNDDNTLLGLSLIVGFLFLVYALLERYRGLILVGIAQSMDDQIAPKLHAYLLSSKRVSSSNPASLADLTNVKQFLTGQPILSFLDAPWTVVYLAVIFMIHPLLGLLSLVSAAALLILAVVNHHITSSKLANAQQASSDEKKMMHNASAAFESVFVLGMTPAIKAKIHAIRQSYLGSLIEASVASNNTSSATKFFRTLIQSAALGFGAYLAIKSQMSAGMIIAGSILLGRILAPIEGILNSWKQLSDFKKSYRHLGEALGFSQHQNPSVDLGRPSGKLELVNASVTLRKNAKPSLDTVSLVVPFGQTLAIIGPSGAGKTTLLKILSAVLTPSVGQALLDGSDLAHRDFDTLGPHLGYLGQNTDLLSGKISHNIARFGDIDSQELLTAAKLSGAHDVVMSLPEGYETVLGDNGYGLSEGQKRKIALARAFYRSPAVLFLDEPGNGLDDASLSQVMKAISTLQEKGTTIVFTTHQNALVQLADQVLLLVEGKVQMHAPKNKFFPANTPKVTA